MYIVYYISIISDIESCDEKLSGILHYEATIIWYNEDDPKHSLENPDSDAYVIIDCKSTLPKFSYDVFTHRL